MRMNGLSFNQGAAKSISQATLISVVPFPIDEFKPGLIPGQFHIDACLDGRPVCQVIGDSHFYVYIDADRGNLRVPAPSQTVAQSIVFDYTTAQLEAKEECHPGIFWVPGVFTTEKVEKELKEELAYIRGVQHQWFCELVKRADDDWEKTRQHYAISDMQRHALRSIDPTNSKNRPWILVTDADKNLGIEKTKICASCGSDVPEMAVICRYCQYVIDPIQYGKMQFAGGNMTSANVDLSRVAGIR